MLRSENQPFADGIDKGLTTQEMHYKQEMSFKQTDGDRLLFSRINHAIRVHQGPISSTSACKYMKCLHNCASKYGSKGNKHGHTLYQSQVSINLS